MRGTIFGSAFLLLTPLQSTAGVIGEGFSSAEPGSSADIRYRAFTVVTLPDVCADSPRPAEILVYPEPIALRVGDRIHRSNENRRRSELVIEAYDESGEFLPAIPIDVATTGIEGVTESRADWDYFEAAREGEDELVVAWLCAPIDSEPVTARVRIVVGPRAGAHK